MFYPSLVQESISHQFDRKFYLALVDACEGLGSKYESLGNPTKSSELSSLKSEINAIIAVVKEHTKLTLDLGMYASSDVNAYVDIGPLGINHPFFKWVHDHFDVTQSDLNASKVVAKIINDSQEPIGWVDRVNHKVGGIFTEIEFDTKLSTALIKNLSADKVAAILLHEIGHAFTTLEYLTGVLCRNYAMGSIAQVIFRQTDLDAKVLLINSVKDGITNAKNYPHLSNNEYQSKTGRKFTITGDIIDTQVAAEAKTEEELTIYLINAAIKPFYSDSGNYYYDTSGAEFLADQFAVRCGAGASLVEGLHEVYSSHMERNLAIRILASVVELLLIGYALTALIIIVSVALTPYPIKQYDAPKDRIIRIRNEMVDALKDPDLDPKHKKRYIDDIERCNVLLREYNRYFSIIGFVTRMIFPSKRKQHNDMLLQKKLEALANTNLFASAAKFEITD